MYRPIRDRAILPPGRDSDTTLENPAFLHALGSWCKEREAYPSRLEVNLPNTLSDGMPIFVAAKPRNKGDISYVESPRHVLIRETLIPSTVDRLTTVLQGIHDQQRLTFRDGLCYVTQLYLVLYDLERMQASKTSMLSPHGYAQREEPQPRTLARFSRLWSLDDVLQFWERFDGQLNRGFLPPKNSHRGRWSYDTIPPHWFLYKDYDNYQRSEHRLPSGSKKPSPPSVPIMVPAPWKEWVENLVALLQVPAQHGVHINISVGPVGTPDDTALPLPKSPHLSGTFRCSEDFRTVHLRGQAFTLTSKQAEAVQFMYKQHQSRIGELSQDRILTEIDSTSPRLRDLFRSTQGAWGTLIIPGSRRGMFRLNIFDY